MNKSQVREAIVELLESQLLHAQEAANQAHDLATHEQSVAETQYDTVGLEASYLAQGQSQRVIELQAMLQWYRNLVLPDGLTKIQVNALLTLESATSDTIHLFVGAQGGGLEVVVEGSTVMVISLEAPLSKQLLGLEEGDDVNLPNKGVYEIAHIS